MNSEKIISKRSKILKDKLIARSLGDRSNEWFTHDMFNDIKNIRKEHEFDSVMIRKAYAIDVMLRALSDKENSKKTFTAKIFDEDLLLGTLPMGSNGLGKVFPEYLNEFERRAGSITNRGSMSLLGHNTLNYEKLVEFGLERIIEECTEKLNIEKDVSNDSLLKKHHLHKQQYDFYKSVLMSCKSVIDYANRMADLAEEESIHTSDKHRAKELIEMARIARKVPAKKADTFYEALQSIWFYHLALHASTNFISLGRLDQVLNPFLENEKDKKMCLELFEQFLIKGAWRINLNLTPSNIIKQDHVDNNTVLGVNPYLIDQKAGVNNFLQNIIVGGVTPDGKDAANECSYLILDAFSNVNLSTPGIYVRIGKRNSSKLKEAVTNSWKKTNNNPSIINDDVMIPALISALSQMDDNISIEKKIEIEKLANDFCVDGCWEPILNGKCDWTFGMMSALTPLECAINEGAMLSSDPELFRGEKKAPYTKKPESFDDLMQAFDEQLAFFIDQNIIALFLYYMIDEYSCPSPLLSAYLEGCMEKGRDKASSGTNHNIGGIILSGVPNLVNTLAAIKKWVYPDGKVGKYTFDQVRLALKQNYISEDKHEQLLFDNIRIDFSSNTEKFASNYDLTNSIAKDVLDMYYARVLDSAKFAKKVFQDKPYKDEEMNIIALRNIAGYYGLSLEEKFGEFNMHITAGLGTFEQYNWLGRGNAASADRRKSEPLAPNFSPTSGSVHNGIGSIFATMSKLKLERFAAGVITDTCLQTDDASEEHLLGIIEAFIEFGGAMLTLAVGNQEKYREIYAKAKLAFDNDSSQDSMMLLKEYADINVRIGGWQTPFITLPLSHMENYIERPMDLG